MAQKKANTSNMSAIRKITVTAIMTAIAILLQYVEFPIPMLIPAFIKLDFSDMPELLTSFALGPWYGALVAILKNLIHLPFTSSAGVGELSNALLGVIFVVPAGYIYKAKGAKTRKHALLGSLAGAATMAVTSFPLNMFLVYPAYVKVYGMPMEGIIGMYSAILPAVHTLPQALFIFNVPFTLIKGLLDVAITFIIYKRISPLIKGTAKN